MSLKELVKEFEQEMELEKPLRHEAEGVYLLYYDHNTPISIIESGNGYSLEVEFCDLPEEGDKTTFFTHCLIANLFFQGTAGAILGLNEEGSKLVLVRDANDASSYKIFEEHIEDLFSAIGFWRDEVEEAWS